MSAEELAATVTSEPFPPFEGQPVVEAVLKFAGELVVRRPLPLGARVVVIHELVVHDSGHKATDGGVKATYGALKATAYELEGRLGVRALAAARKADRLATETGSGRTPIEGFVDAEGDADGLELTTDGAGVVMTPEELAELGLADGSDDPRVVILFGGQRTMWPDDFPKGTPRPDAGDMVAVPGSTDEDAQVVEVLDPLTGETVAAWTDEDEDARLLDLEQAAEVEEAQAEARLVNRPPWPGYDDQSAREIISQLTTEVDDAQVAWHCSVYESAHKDRSGVKRTAAARVGTLKRQTEGVVEDEHGEDLPPLPDDDPSMGEES